MAETEAMTKTSEAEGQLLRAETAAADEGPETHDPKSELTRYYIPLLTLYHTIPTFDNPEKVAI